MYEAFQFSKIDYNSLKDQTEKKLASDMCKRGIARLVSSTLIEKLDDDGRKPIKTVVLLEQPKLEDLKSGIDIADRQRDIMLMTLGLVKFSELASKLPKGKVEYNDISIEDVLDEEKKNAELNFFTVYSEDIRRLIDSVCNQDLNLNKSCETLFKTIGELYDEDCQIDLYISDFLIDKRIQPHTDENTKRGFLLQCYILSCVNEEKVLKNDKEAKQIPRIVNVEWKKIEDGVYTKKKEFEAAYRYTADLKDSYTALGLAPVLYKPAMESFGLNESGNVKSTVVEVKTKKKKKEDDDSLIEKETELVEKIGKTKRWIDGKAFPLFVGDYSVPEDNKQEKAGDESEKKSAYKTLIDNYEKFKESLGRESVSAEEYKERSVKLVNYHKDLYDKLEAHVNKVMSNYSGRSVKNDPAILRKRSVNVGEDTEESRKNDYKYIIDKSKIDTDPSESIIEISKRSYVTVMIQYLTFDAGRRVAMTNIKEQCEWFNNRIDQIKKSLEKLRFILMIMIFALTAVFLPFVLIQWESIVRNMDTVLVALVSLAVPYVLLLIFYFIAAAIQKQKMHAAWDKLLRSSDEVLAENRKAISAYDDMMTKYIPSLRWIYEYVLDVDFHLDCCKIADNKLSHHRGKLAEMIEALGNFLEDLDYDQTRDSYPQHNPKSIDYTKSFCDGETNRKFYSIVDKEILDMIFGREGGHN